MSLSLCDFQELHISWLLATKTQKDIDYLNLVTSIGSSLFTDRDEQKYYCHRYHELPKRYRDLFHTVYLDKPLKVRLRLAMASLQQEQGKWAKRASLLRSHASVRYAERQWLATLCKDLDTLCAPKAADALVYKRLAEIVNAMKDPQTSTAVLETLRLEAQRYGDEFAAGYIRDMDAAMAKAIGSGGSKEEVASIMKPHLAWKKFQTARLMAIKVAALPEVRKRDSLLEKEKEVYEKARQSDIENSTRTTDF